MSNLHQEWKEILERLSNDSASWAWYAMDSKRAKKAHIEEPHFDVDKALLALVKSLKEHKQDLIFADGIRRKAIPMAILDELEREA